jgi:opacity protein-like surface antigen
MLAPSAAWGTERIWQSQTTVHNPMFDEKGRVWFTARIRPPSNPAFCKKGSDHPSAKLFPVERAGRHLTLYEPESKKFTLIDTCFSTHHLAFAEDANHTLWLSSGGASSGILGWINRKVFDETGDEQKSQGWTPFILDTNGNGKRDEYVEPNQPVDPTKDKRIVAGYYGIGINLERRIDLGLGAEFSRRGDSRGAGRQSAGDGVDGILRSAMGRTEGRDQWLRAARHGHRSRWRRVGSARERPPGEL